MGAALGRERPVCLHADITGLQTFATHYYRNGIPVETQARWAWYSDPNPNGFKLSDANRPFSAYGKTVQYPTNDRTPAGMWLRENPRDMPLPQLAFERIDGRPISPDEVKRVSQVLDLWTGVVTTSFTLDGQTVNVWSPRIPGRTRCRCASSHRC